MPSARVLLACFLRSFFVGAGLNARGMQNIGLLFALWPGLTAIHTTPEARSMAYRRYAGHYNCHPLWTPMLIAMFLRLEHGHSRGIVPAEVLDRFRNTTIHTLSAIGDSVFAGSLTVFWALASGLLVTLGLPWTALLFSLLFILTITAFKFYGFILGWRTGLAALSRVKRWNLINRGDTVKFLNALLLALLCVLLLAKTGMPGLAGLFGTAPVPWPLFGIFFGVTALFWGLVLLALRLHIPRFLAPLSLLIVLALVIFFVYSAPAL